MRKALYVSAFLFMCAAVVACSDTKTDPEPQGPSDSVCGDGVCDEDETVDSCPADCEETTDAECGNGVCEDGESVANCSEDCKPTAPVVRCGDGVCEEDETADNCAIDCDAAYDDGNTCTAVYVLEATMDIRDTPGERGDAINGGLAGQLALRYRQHSEDPESPADGGRVEVLHYFVRNEMNVEPMSGLVIDTKVNGFTPTCNGITDLPDKIEIPETCAFDDVRDSEAKATGVYASDDGEVVWQRCVAPAAYYDLRVRNSAKELLFTPDDSSEGPGCLNNYRSQGNVNCNGNLCSLGGLNQGDNIQNDTWNQPLEKFTLTSDGTEVGLSATRVPNREDGNTFVSFTGTRSSIDCEP